MKNKFSKISDDLLDREDELNTISKFIEIIPGPFVIAVEGPWGVGKTYFSKLLINKIKDDTQSVYINAWEKDFIDDPILTILRGLINQFEKNKIPVDDIKAKSKKYLKTAYPYLIDSITGGIVSKDLIDDITDNYFEQKEKREELLDEVIFMLEKLVSNLVNKKIVVIIDELDRCRPNYAIEFIERIKHLFNIEGVIFLLSINRSQLEKSIRKIYGQEIDSETYLHRFIDYEYHLSLKLNSNFIFDKLDKLGLIDKVGSNRAKKLANLIKFLSDIFNSTPRDINQITAHFSLILKSTGYKLVGEIDDFYLTLLFISQASKATFQDILNLNVNSLKIFKRFFESIFHEENLNTYRIADLILPFLTLDKQNSLLNELKSLENKQDPETHKERNLNALRDHINNKQSFYGYREYKDLIETFRYKLHSIN